MDRLSDEELVTLCLSGETDAFAVLVRRYEKRIYALAYRICGSYDEAGDLAQEAFLQVYQALGKFDASRRFSPWLFRVAHNVCVNGIAKRPKNTVYLEDIGEAAETTAAGGEAADPAGQYEAGEALGGLYDAIMALPPQYREPLLLKYIENCSYQEIAERLQLPVSTVETRLFRARKQLSRLLEKEKVGT